MNDQQSTSGAGDRAREDAGEPFLKIRCFGSFELHREGRLLPPDAVQRRGAITLLKILLVNEGRAVPRDMLAEALWPGADPNVTANRLYVLIHALRRAIEPSPRRHKRRWTFICNDGDRYYFNPEAPYRCDIREFRRAVEVGERQERSGNLRGAVDSYSAALDLYTGDLFEDEPYAEWCWAERESLRETALDIASKTASQYDRWGAPGQSIVYYQRALRLDPLREQIHRRLIEALLAAGRRSEALRQYSTCEELLRRELGIEPMPETQRLYRVASENLS
jgi:DNA-binding SARP family transcriptional activator